MRWNCSLKAWWCDWTCSVKCRTLLWDHFLFIMCSCPSPWMSQLLWSWLWHRVEYTEVSHWQDPNVWYRPTQHLCECIFWLCFVWRHTSVYFVRGWVWACSPEKLCCLQTGALKPSCKALALVCVLVHAKPLLVNVLVPVALDVCQSVHLSVIISNRSCHLFQETCCTLWYFSGSWVGLTLGQQPKRTCWLSLMIKSIIIWFVYDIIDTELHVISSKSW